MTDAALALDFLRGLTIPEGPLAGQPMQLAPFQRDFVEGALAVDTTVAVLSIGRGNAKTALSAGVALGALLGIWDNQPRREVVLAARVRDQARIGWDFVAGFARTLPEEVQARLTFRRSPRLEIEYEDDTGSHYVRAIAADGKSALGGSPTLVLMDERGHWPAGRGDDLEHALMSGLGKRAGKALIISTSAATDIHPFSKWVDDDLPGKVVFEHRPQPGLPADDLDSLLIANPGAVHGIGADPDWLVSTARRAIAQGGSALTSFRLYNRNERVSGEARDVLLTVDEWLACEVDDLPPRAGPVVVGVDLGGSSSMSAAAYYWYETGRLEVFGTFPSKPSLLDRGQRDGVSGRYVEMEARGELRTLGAATVPVAPWLADVLRYVEGETIAAVVADRFRQAEAGEGMQAAGLKAPVVFRGMGYRDGSEDVERFRRAVFDGNVRVQPSLLLRSAFADAVCLKDEAGNVKVAKGRSTGRIDAASATVLAVAEGARIAARGLRVIRPPRWA